MQASAVTSTYLPYLEMAMGNLRAHHSGLSKLWWRAYCKERVER